MTKNLDMRKRVLVLYAPAILVAIIVFIFISFVSQRYPQLANFQIALPMIAGFFVFCITFASISWFRSTQQTNFATDVSHLNAPMPDHLQDTVNLLEAADFSLLGSLSYDTTEEDIPSIWLFADKQGFTQALARRQGLLTLITVFEDGFALASNYVPQTSYRDGHENIQFIQKYTSHNLRANKAQAKHGELISLATVSDYLDWEIEHGVEQRKKQFRTIAIMFFGGSIFMASLLIDSVISILETFILIPNYVNNIALVMPFVIAIILVVWLYQSGYLALMIPSRKRN